MFYRCCAIFPQIEICFGKKPCSAFAIMSRAYFRSLSVSAVQSFKKGWQALVSVSDLCSPFIASRGCFESCSKPSTIIAVDEPSKGLRIQGRSVSKDSLSDDFWTSENCDVDNSGIQSQRSISSMSMSNQPLDPSNTPGNTSNPAEFVNHGFLLWNQTRQQWLSKKRNHDKQIREPSISWNASYESLLGTNKRFGQPIPLPEMVDFLVDVWEQEGLYD